MRHGFLNALLDAIALHGHAQQREQTRIQGQGRPTMGM